MRRAQLLDRIQDLCGTDAPGRADLILHTVLDALRGEMTGAEVQTVASCLPRSTCGTGRPPRATRATSSRRRR